MKLHPLVFSFRDIIAGNGFFALVVMDGRVLLTEEDDHDIWMFGVQPGGLAGGVAGGGVPGTEAQRNSAFAEFKKGYLSVLFDIASEAVTFEDFDTKTKAFFDEVNTPNALEWEKALAEVRATNACLSGLKTVPADANPPKLAIEKIAPEFVKPNLNEFDDISKAA